MEIKYNNMNAFLKDLKGKKEIKNFCKRNNLSFGLLKEISKLNNRGFTNKQIAEHLGTFKEIVDRYIETLKNQTHEQAGKEGKQKS